EYELTRDDLMAFFVRSLKKNQDLSQLETYDLCSYVLACFWLGQHYLYRKSLWDLASLLFLLVLLGLFAARFFIWRKMKIREIWWAVEKETPYWGLLCRHKVVIDERAFTEITDVNETRYLWAAMERIEENTDYIFVYASSIRTYAVPKRAFVSDAEA